MEQAHKDLLQGNHVKLRDIICDDVSNVVDFLWNHRILTRPMKDKVLQITKTPSEQASDLLMRLRTRGPDAFQALYDSVLAADLTEAADILRPELAPHGTPYQSPSAQQSSSGSAPGSSYADLSDDEDLPDHWPLTEEEQDKKVTVKTLEGSRTSRERLQKLYNDSCSIGQKEYYPMLHKKRGLCLIIDNEKFDHLEDRVGTKRDANNLNFLFTGLGFDTFIATDKKCEDMEYLLEKKIRGVNHTNSDCVVLVILSHGDEGVVFGTDGYRDSQGKPQKGLAVERIRTLVCGTPSLVDKPKLIFLQACRGLQKDLGITRDGAKKEKTDGLGGATDEKDGGPTGSSRHGGEDGQIPTGRGASSGHNPEQDSDGDINLNLVHKMVQNFNKPVEDEVDARSGEVVPSVADAFLSMSTTLGYLSWRNTKTGTWFIQAIVYIFSRFAYKHNICTLMTKVNNLVSRAEEEKYGYKQICEFTPTMKRGFYFFPKLSTID